MMDLAHRQVLSDVDGAHLQLQREERPRQYHPKRSHKKSRKGCVNCKNRKVKCDEGHPSCRACKLRDDTCVYAAAPSGATRSQTRRPFTFVQTTFPSGKSPFTSKLPSSAASPSADNLAKAGAQVLTPRATPPLRTSDSLGCLPPSERYDIVDMRLLWNYTLKAMWSFLADDDFRGPAVEVLQHEVVNRAFEAPFLMDSVLALSNQEMQRRDPQHCPKRAVAYYARAVRGYNLALQQAKPETLPAILVNSVFICFITAHNFRDPAAKDLYIVDWMYVWRGIGAIANLVGLDLTLESKFGIIIYRPPFDPKKGALGVPDDLRAMINNVPPDDEDYAYLPAYRTTLDLLGSLYYQLRLGWDADHIHRVSCWLSHMPRSFVTVAEMRRPRALIIVAHYACFIKTINHLWWLEGVAERTIRDIHKHLSPEWRPFLRKPMAILPLVDVTTIVRILLDDPLWVNPTRTREEIEEGFVYLADKDPLRAAGFHLQAEQRKGSEQDVLVDGEMSRQMSHMHL